MSSYWWTDTHGEEHGPVTASRLIALRSERAFQNTTLIRSEEGAKKPFYELVGSPDFKAEMQRAGQKDMRLVMGILGGGLVGFASLFVAIYASAPLSAFALAVFALCSLALAFIAGRHRQVGLSMTAMLIPAAVGMMGTIQQPALLEPLTGLACNQGETLVSRRARVFVESTFTKTQANSETIFWTACVTPESGRKTYLPMFAQGLVLFLLFGLSNRLGRHLFPIEG